MKVKRSPPRGSSEEDVQPGIFIIDLIIILTILFALKGIIK